MKILCEAVSFGFGPITKLLSISQLLGKKYAIDFIGSGSSLELAKRSNLFNRIYYVDTLSDDIYKYEDAIRKYDLAISIGNSFFSEYIILCNIKIVIVDSLFYMRSEIKPSWRECDLLLIQSFKNEAEKLDLLKNQIKNPHIISPIISEELVDKEYQNNNDLMLINFGGADYPFFSSFDMIPTVISRIIKSLINIKNNKFKKVRVAIGPRCLDKLRNENFNVDSIATYSHSDFLKELQNAQLLFTLPGLTTAYEAFALRIPTLFLPPLNYSQFNNLCYFMHKDLTPPGINWNYQKHQGRNTYLDVSEGSKFIETMIANAFHNNNLENVCENCTKMASTWKSYDKYYVAQREFMEKSGKNGTQKAVELIVDLLENR